MVRRPEQRGGDRCGGEPKLLAEPLQLTDGSRTFLAGLSFYIGDKSGEVRRHGMNGKGKRRSAAIRRP